MNDANNALAPCPFCKSRCVTATRDEHGWKIVECDDCGARGPCIDLDGDQYIDRWNALSTPNAPVEPAGLRSLRHLLGHMPDKDLHLRRFDAQQLLQFIDAILAVRLDESQAKALSEAETTILRTVAVSNGHAARANAVEARLAEAMRVIEPFAQEAQHISDTAKDGNLYTVAFLVREFRAARAFTNAANQHPHSAEAK